MSEKINHNPESTPNLDDITEKLSDLNKQLDVIDIFRAEPTVAAEQQALFLDGIIDQPTNDFPHLEQMDLTAIYAEINNAANDLGHIDIPEQFRQPYELQISTYEQTANMLEAAQQYNQMHGLESARKFMEANIQIYGEPDRATYEGLVTNLKSSVEQQDLTGRAATIRQELLGLLPETDPNTKPFHPTQETVDWAENVIMAIQQPFLDFIPNQKKFTPAELQTIFTKILHEGMGEAGDDWQVILSKEARAIDVNAAQKTITIPDNDLERSKSKVEHLTVHEIGVHALRSIMGSDTNIDMLRTGMPNYLDAEEGLAVTSEQALDGKYEDRGVPYYIIAGGEYFHHQSFRDTYEITWRRNALTNLKNQSDITDEQIAKAQKTAYNQVFRINRGTNDLPWFKDLAYYNGNRKIWNYFGRHIDDVDAILNLYYGKVDPDNSIHMRAAWDATPNPD